MSGPDFKVALVSMPWSVFNRPSIQLGALKAYLETDGAISATSFHPYLEISKRIGSETYNQISLRSWTSEALYSALLFPEKKKDCEKLVSKESAGSGCVLDFASLTRLLEDQLHEWIRSIDWNDFDLVGFSVCFNQLLSSLTAASALKRAHPDLPVVFGGSSCIADMAAGMFSHFPIDFMITGEGEGPLLNLCRFLARDTQYLHPRVFSKKKLPNRRLKSDNQVSINSLPVPDYDDYFSSIQKVYGDIPFIPDVPMEFSRGCWWDKCVFCNLNLQWKGYRFKSAGKMTHELDTLIGRHEGLNFAFTDNVLPFKQAREFFRAAAVSCRDVHFFGEIRANQRGEYLRQCKQGGLSSVQAGIEALSETLLKRMKKGVSVIENIAVMRDAAEYGIVLNGNLIVEFPGSTQGEVQETLSVLDFLFPYHPLSTAAFFLGYGSPVACDCRQYGIAALLPHHRMKALFPKDITRDLHGLVRGYRGDRQAQRKLWAPVREKVRKWQEMHEKKNSTGRPFLSFRDGGNFLIIRQEMIDGQVYHHRLRALSRKIYLSCLQINSVTALLSQFPELQEDKLLSFIDSLVRKKIMFRQEEKILSLAVRYPH